MLQGSKLAIGLRAWVVVPIGTAMLVIFAMIGVGLYWAAAQSDDISTARQFRVTEQAITLSGDELARQQETVAIWDDLVVRIRAAARNRKWLDENAGVWLHNLFGHDEVFVIDARDRPLYAMMAGVGVAPERFEGRRAAFAPLIAQLRTERPAPPVVPGRPPRPVRTGDLIRVDGRLAVVSAMRVAPLTPAVRLLPGEAPVILCLRYLGPVFLAELTERDLIEAPRISPVGATVAGEAQVPLHNRRGETVGYFVWRPELPGTAVLASLVPVAVLGGGFIAALLTVVCGWLLRTTQRLHGTMVQLRASETEAQHVAYHDLLTGLANRARFEDRVDHALAQMRRGRGGFTMMLLDLDRFKHVNDTFGHQAGDALIQQFGARLSAILRSEDLLARLGGDEFAILAAGDADRGAIDDLCRRILDAVRTPFDVLGNQAFVGVSIGVVQAPQGGSDRIELMRRADIALYRAKAEGRDCFRHFNAAMDAKVRMRSTIEEDLRGALASGEGLDLHFQPLVDDTGKIVGAEALLRWEHPLHGTVSPQQAVPIAEETGLILPLGEWVMRRACAAARRWPELFIAVNLSPVQFRAAGFAGRLLAIVHEAGVSPRQIELEVTETVLIDDDDKVRDALMLLRRAGMRIALDDFGTGYSSLSYLQRFKVDKIKIDRSFVQHLGEGEEAGAVVSAVVTLGHAMGLTVTAEGVETGDQRRFLERAGCNQMQGYFFSRALAEQDFERLVASPARRHGAAA